MQAFHIISISRSPTQAFLSAYLSIELVRNRNHSDNSYREQKTSDVTSMLPGTVLGELILDVVNWRRPVISEENHLSEESLREARSLVPEKIDNSLVNQTLLIRNHDCFFSNIWRILIAIIYCSPIFQECTTSHETIRIF